MQFKSNPHPMYMFLRPTFININMNIQLGPIKVFAK